MHPKSFWNGPTPRRCWAFSVSLKSDQTDELDELSKSNYSVEFRRQVTVLFFFYVCVKLYLAFDINLNEEVFYNLSYFAFLFFFFRPNYIPTNRKTRKSSITWMLVSLCFSMLIFNIIFISGIENHNARKDSSDTSGNNQQFSTYTTTNTILTSDVVDPPADAWCMVVAVLLHYFLLATFMWTALNSAQLYLLLLRTMKPFPGHFIVTMSAIGWGKIYSCKYFQLLPKYQYIVQPERSIK